MNKINNDFYFIEVAHPQSGFSSNIPSQIKIWKSWFLRRRRNQRTWRKTSHYKRENQQQTAQPIYGINARVWTWMTWVGSQCINVPPLPPDNSWIILRFWETVHLPRP